LIELERDREVDDPVEIDMGLSAEQIAAALEYQPDRPSG
jgi:hypothetical protein